MLTKLLPLLTMRSVPVANNRLYGASYEPTLVKFGSLFGDYNKIAGSDISASNGSISWGNYYNAINLANTVMYYDKQVFLKDKTFTQKIKNGVDAEALFIRSLSYFYLVRLWKDVPLVLEPSHIGYHQTFSSKIE